jgi:dTDP-4-dehydrorhamnose 3,5-epimerase-like enzyme
MLRWRGMKKNKRLLEKKEDERGWLIELFKGSLLDDKIKGQVYSFSINPGAKRGNHYHKRKTEWFSILEGRCKLILEQDGEEEEIILESENPLLVKVLPNVRHTFENENEEKAIVIAYIDEEFNPNDPDTFR